jgi:hypothetical protein
VRVFGDDPLKRSSEESGEEAIEQGSGGERNEGGRNAMRSVKSAPNHKVNGQQRPMMIYSM